MTQLSFTFNSLQSALASAERVFDLLDESEMEADPLPAAAAKLPGKVEGRVAFLSTCALVIRPTSRLCTTCRLPPSRARRLPWWEPRARARRRSSTCSCASTRLTAGVLRSTAWIRAAWTAASYGSSLAWCCRTPWLFDGTIAENIAYGCPEATREEIVAARARRAGRLLCAHHAAGL